MPITLCMISLHLMWGTITIDDFVEFDEDMTQDIAEYMARELNA